MNFSRLSLCTALSFALAGVMHAQAPAAAPSPTAVIYDAASVDKAPTPKKRLKPDFPSSVKKGDVPGEITLRYVVTPEGKVTGMGVVKFNDADMIGPALEALEQTEFEPGEKAGKPVSVRVETTLFFPEPKAPKPPKKEKKKKE